MPNSMHKPIKNRIVRDLAWALLSPHLLKPFDKGSTYLLQQEYIDDKAMLFDWLLAIDQSPEHLITHVQQRSQVRIGIYFEQLLGFYFSHYPRFELLEQNLQIQGKERTLGEFDFIIFDNGSGHYFHIESAVKFYLGYFQSTAVTKNIQRYNWHEWIGPNKKDSLSLKMHSMTNKQLRLSQTPEAYQLLTEKNIPIDNLQTRLLLRGRFFCHATKKGTPQYAHHEVCQHYWQTFNHFKQSHSNNEHYIILPRIYWLSPMCQQDIIGNNLLMEKEVLIETIQQELQQGIKTWMIATISTVQTTIETERFFIVADD